MSKIIPKRTFDTDAYWDELEHTQPTEPYDYEKYKAINPNLTPKMYDYLYHRRCLKAVELGKRIEFPFNNAVLEAVWWRDSPNYWFPKK